jgi:Rrf2 family nitric oxide-sensitive transcriptional repressor
MCPQRVRLPGDARHSLWRQRAGKGKSGIEVVRSMEDDLALVECFANGNCVITPTCHLRGILDEALAAFLAALDRYTLADLIGQKGKRELAKLLGLFPLPAPGAQIPRNI